MPAQPVTAPSDDTAVESHPAQNPKVHEAHPEVPAAQRAAGGGCPFHRMLAARDVSGLVGMADQLVREQTFGSDSLARARAVLKEARELCPSDPDGEINGRLGRIDFLEERYGDAYLHLQIASDRNPSHPVWGALAERARVNVDTRIARPLMTHDQFNDSQAGKSPSLFLDAPRNLKGLPKQDPTWSERLTRPARSAGSAFASAITNATVALAGKAAKATRPDNGPWTTWYKRPGFVGTLEIARDRQWMDGNLLRSTYGNGASDAQPAQPKPAWTDRFRTANGSYNTKDPMEGAAGMEFQFQGLAGVEKRVSRMHDASLPSPREVSRIMLAAKPGVERTAPHVNVLALAWVQMMVHDWIDHGAPSSTEAYTIDLAADDPLRAKYGRDTMFVPKTAPNPTRPHGAGIYRNKVTHWWDASQLYGSDQDTQNRLRMGPDGKFLPGGKLRLDGDHLPINAETGIEDSGFTGNWWGGLSLVHTTFVKHHNWICDQLVAAHPDWDTDQLFQTARLINAAIIAKIHTVEFTPALSPNKTLNRSLAINWWGMGEALSKPIGERRELSPWDLGGDVLSGIIGGKTDNKGAPFGFSEKFVDVYRLFHAAVPDTLQVRRIGSEDVATVDIDALRASNTRRVEDEVGMANLLNSFGHQHLKALVANNYPAFMQEMSVNGNAVVDLGAVDIIRSRERGEPAYNEFRRQIGLKPIADFKDLGCDDETTRALRKLYGEGKEGVDKLDLIVGVLAESVRPTNMAFGETLFHATSQMANRRLQADPFYTERYNADVYTKEGLQIVEKARLKDILLLHWPELAKTGLMHVNNPFEPWGTNASSHPDEHPLTAQGVEKYGPTF